MFRTLPLQAPLACAAVLACAVAGAQDYPSKPVRVIVPFATGGGSDITARNMSLKLTGEFNQQFIVENKPGAGGVVGLETLIKSPPDGYTIMISTSSWSTAAALSKPTFDPTNDIAPVIEIGFNPLVLSLHPSVPAKNPRELIALAKARPGQLAYATPGIGAITHLAMELMLHMAKIDLLSVPYKSTGLSVIDLLAGHVQTQFSSLPVVIQYVRTGKLRMVAQTGKARSPAVKDVPTMLEAGVKGFIVSSGFGMFAPANTPRPIVDRVHDTLIKALGNTTVREALAGQGADPVGSTPEEFAAFTRSEIDKWIKVVRDAGIQPE